MNLWEWMLWKRTTLCIHLFDSEYWLIKQYPLWSVSGWQKSRHRFVFPNWIHLLYLYFRDIDLFDVTRDNTIHIYNVLLNKGYFCCSHRTCTPVVIIFSQGLYINCFGQNYFLWCFCFISKHAWINRSIRDRVKTFFP